MYKVAVIGAGVISDSHFEGWQKIPSAEVAVIVDMNENVAKEKAGKWNVERVETDYKKTLNEEEIDIIDLCIPHHLHADITIECLKAGKHVICEKPIALTIEDAKRVQTALNETDKKLMIAENWYYIPSVAEGIKTAKSGDIGKVFSVKANLDFPGLRSALKEGGSRSGWRAEAAQSGGGILMDAGIHSLSVIRQILGEVESVVGLEGERIHTNNNGVEDAFNVLMKFKNGGTAICHCTESSGWNMPKFDFEILGTNGAVMVDLIKQKVSIYKNEKLDEREIQAKGGMTEELEHFVECIDKNKKPMSDSEDQTKSLALVLAAYKSARNNGQPVNPDDLLSHFTHGNS